MILETQIFLRQHGLDALFQRVKIKSPQYVALHQLRDQVSVPRLLEIARSSEGDKSLTCFPDFRARYEALIAQIEVEFASIQHLETPRQFAEEAKIITNPAALFALRNHKAASAREFLAAAHLGALVSCLGLRGVESGSE